MPRRESLKSADDFRETLPCPAALIDASSIHQVNDAVNMIRHDDESIETYVGVMLSKRATTHLDSRAEVVELHCSLDNTSQQTSAIVRADGDKVRSGLAVVVAGEAQNFTT